MSALLHGVITLLLFPLVIVIVFRTIVDSRPPGPALWVLLTLLVVFLVV